MSHEITRGELLCSDDPSMLDRGEYHAFIARSYWATGIPRGVMERAIANSLCFGAYAGEPRRMVGAARVISDRATYAYLCDVFVHEDWRRRGVGKLLMDTLLTHPELQGLRRFCLLTKDAHGLYEQYGFTVCENPERYMEKLDREVYKRAGGKGRSGKPPTPRG